MMDKYIAIDLRTGRLTNDIHTGSTGFISWPRLVELMEKAGEIRPFEKAIILELDEKGMQFIVVPSEGKKCP